MFLAKPLGVPAQIALPVCVSILRTRCIMTLMGVSSHSNGRLEFRIMLGHS